MKLPLLLLFATLELAAMQQVEIPGDTTAVAKSIIAQSGRAETKTNLQALTHTLNAVKLSPGLPNPEAGAVTQLDSIKTKLNKFFAAAQSPTVTTPATGVVQEAEKLVDEAIDFWAGNTADAATAQKRQKIAAMISTAVSLAGNATLLALVIYYRVEHGETVGSFLNTTGI